MNMDFSQLFRVKGLIDGFFYRHPKSKTLVDNVKAKGFCEGQEIAIAIRYPDGSEYKAGVRLSNEDLELFNMLKEI